MEYFSRKTAMLKIPPVELSTKEIQNLSSDYISIGLKKEKWIIKQMSISSEVVIVDLMMTDLAFSSNDKSGFHLSFLTAMEMIAQMMVIYLHHQAGYKVKTREIWVSRINSKFIKPIRDPNNISIKMIPRKIKTKGDSLVCDAECEITSSSDGLFQSEGRVWLI